MEPVESKESQLRAVESVLKQTPFRSGYFDFGKAKTANYSYFNPGLVEMPEGLFLIARRSQNWRNVRIGFNDLVAVKLNETTYQPQVIIPVVTRHYFDKEHFEDARAIYRNGVLYVSACNFVIVNNGKGWTGSHMVVNTITNRTTRNGWQVNQRIDPIYGNNGPRIGMDKGMEKNWLWFFHDGRPHLLYQAFPQTVVEFNESYQPIKEHITNEVLNWEWGVIRGGTPPVLSPDGTEYITFFHSSLPVGNKYHRQYHMGAYAFESKPPFAITRISPRPILSGSEKDLWSPRKPLVVFPCGSRLKDGQWLVTFGINDLMCGWIEIPHATLMDSMVPMNQPKPEWQKTLFTKRLKLNDVTLVCIDDIKPRLAQQAMEQCQRHAKFGEVQFFTSQKGYRAVTTPPLRSLLDYSDYLLKEVVAHVHTHFAMVVQWDGYIIHPECWMPQFLEYDYIGAPWPWVDASMRVGNGGFSIRSRRLMDYLGRDVFEKTYLPEDEYICQAKRQMLEERFKIRFAPETVAVRFSNENNAVYNRSFGFHSFLTPMDDEVVRPRIFHHSGDLGDIIYALPTMASLGGGVLFLSRYNLEGHQTRLEMNETQYQNLAGLLEAQPYVDRVQYAGVKVQSADYNLNEFRKGEWSHGESIFEKHLRAFKRLWPQTKPWLSVANPISVADKPIVVSRSGRYHNLQFPWAKLVKAHGRKMIFLGSDREHADFIKQFGLVEHEKTDSLLEAARYIAGARCFVGNQSALMAVALGLGQNVIQESWEGEQLELGDVNTNWDGKGWPNCVIKRDNAIYVRGDESVVIPKDWL